MLRLFYHQKRRWLRLLVFWKFIHKHRLLALKILNTNIAPNFFSKDTTIGTLQTKAGDKVLTLLWCFNINRDIKQLAWPDIFFQTCKFKLHVSTFNTHYVRLFRNNILAIIFEGPDFFNVLSCENCVIFAKIFSNFLTAHRLWHVVSLHRYWLQI